MHTQDTILFALEFSLGASLFSPSKLVEHIGHVAIIQDPSTAYIGLFEPLEP